MKYFIPKERLLSASHDDARFDVAAGTPAIDPALTAPGLFVGSGEHDTAEQFAFSCLVQLLRRRKRLSIQKLAEETRVDIAELVGIESDVSYQPRPRTVHQLANFFGLPEKKLLELSNLTSIHSRELKEAAVRFAANAKNVLELTKEERQALNEFVKFLSSQ